MVPIRNLNKSLENIQVNKVRWCGGKVGAVLSSYVHLDYLMKTDPKFSLSDNLIMASYIPKMGEVGFAMPENSNLYETPYRYLIMYALFM